MDIKELFTNDRAVSPVIGVILMVAITVILAAVIGAFVLGLGDQVSETAPSAQIDFDYDDSEDPAIVTLTHDGGDSFESDRVNITGPVTNDEGVVGWDGTISAGVSSEGNEVDADSGGETIRLVWEGEGGSSSTIARSTVPSGFNASE